MLIILTLKLLVKLGWIKLPAKFNFYKINRIKFLKSYFLINAFVLISIYAQAKNTFFIDKLNQNLPIPKTENQLFYLQRDPDSNTVIYQLNKKNNEIDSQNPINVFWIRYNEGGKIKALNFIQRKFAYGFSSKQIDKNTHEIRLVSYPKLPLYLKKIDNKYFITVEIDNETIVLQNIYVKTNGDLAWPKVYHIELIGKELQSQNFIKKKIVI